LRTIAERMVTQRARASLLDWADALDRHAQIIEQATVKFRDIREMAAAGSAFRDDVHVLRKLVPRGQESD
jgi:hypothetical protein